MKVNKMENVKTERVHGIEIYDYTGESYMPAMSFGKWRVAYLNDAEVFREENFCQMERHNETDEVFILLEGKATLIIGEEMNRIEMEPHKLYNIPLGVWHNIITTEGTRVLIVENEDTGLKNSEIKSIK